MDIEPIDQYFFEKPTLTLAKELIGKQLIKETEEGIAGGWIVETEAYIGPEDRAAHSYNNRRTKRTEVMFGPAGTIYTYVMHTHCLVNIVSGEVDKPEAVLIRAVEPVIGVELMRERRGIDKKMIDLASGPGKLTKALGIVKEDYGLPSYQRPLYIAPGRVVEEIESGPRIGIENSGEARDYPWRFWEKGSKFTSR
ncbi:DNA-3-methyladenine glycosylase [Halalkalibacter krulwichiae]|uniref:Putative 3-methyladenine DNA glycosylase n=1 Tax=Halalkalibacter krulwichiae TaxID=199441 RepID=A0A1X9MLN7_9BACI|nr:DNA-3-methyladenine glycosylase [Halalkalibacter krulwichiae]ARK32841.1 3-methyladenine DNA glycosylase [Halalkalibacter krulwichiae]